MAKFAQVGYGSNGGGTGKNENGYTYVVNDNVKAGDTLYPAVRHYKSDTVFGTTGLVLNTIKDLNKQSASPLMAKSNQLKQEIKKELEEKGIVATDSSGNVVAQDVVKGGESGLSKIVQSKDILNEQGKQALRTDGIGKTPTHEQFVEATREANVQIKKEQLKTQPQTFDEYAREFIGD